MPDYEEIHKRRADREAARKAREERERKQLVRKLTMAAVALALVVIVIFSVATGNPVQPVVDDTLENGDAVETTESNSPWNRDPTTVIHLVAAGDLNVTDLVMASGKVAGGYNFNETFIDVAPIFSQADLAVINLEGNFCGAPYGSETTSAPPELAECLVNLGIDMIQVANSSTVNNGLLGLNQTLSTLRGTGLEPVGAFATPEEFRQSKGYTICEVQGIRIAFVAFTKGVGSLGLPVGSEDCVNLLYTDYATTYSQIDEDQIRRVLRAAENEDPDITIALLHWGSEHNDEIRSTQGKIVELMQKEGVDAIIGTHPHRVHQITYDEMTGAFVAYSLGDLIGDTSRAGTNYSIILDLEITMDNDTGATRITNWSYTPIYTLTETEGGGKRRVVRIHEAMFAYENNFVDRVTKAAYDSMANSLLRIEARVKGE